MLKSILSWLTGGALDRALGTVDRYIESKTDQERIKAEIVETHLKTRGDWMRSGGFWTLLLFGIPTGFHYSAVVLASTFWCAKCAFPQTWTIAALPSPMDQWEGWIVLSCIGGLSLLGMRK